MFFSSFLLSLSCSLSAQLCPGVLVPRTRRGPGRLGLRVPGGWPALASGLRQPQTCWDWAGSLPGRLLFSAPGRTFWYLGSSLSLGPRDTASLCPSSPILPPPPAQAPVSSRPTLTHLHPVAFGFDLNVVSGFWFCCLVALFSVGFQEILKLLLFFPKIFFLFRCSGCLGLSWQQPLRANSSFVLCLLLISFIEA